MGAPWWRAGTSASLQFAVLLLVSVGARSVAATCYGTDGSEDTEGKLLPRDPLAQVTPCCSHADYCLSNGLCLDAGGNNGFSIQGCTDKEWGTGCNLICPLSGVSYDGYVYVQQCSSLNGQDNPLCCGEDYTCCSVSSNVMTTVPLWSTLFRPGGSSTASSTPSETPSSSPTSATGGSDSTSRSSTAENSAASQTSPTNTPSQSAEASSGGGGVDKSLAIGLGVGIPLGLALIAAITFLGMQMRKQNRGATVASPSAQNHQSPYFQSPGTDNSGMNQMYYGAPAQYPQQRQELSVIPSVEIGGTQIKELPSH